jgi:hypothetical protein
MQERKKPILRTDSGLVSVTPLSWHPTEPIGGLDRFVGNGQPG